MLFMYAAHHVRYMLSSTDDVASDPDLLSQCMLKLSARHVHVSAGANEAYTETFYAAAAMLVKVPAWSERNSMSSKQ
jgi:hypothetical protein